MLERGERGKRRTGRPMFLETGGALGLPESEAVSPLSKKQNRRGEREWTREGDNPPSPSPLPRARGRERGGSGRKRDRTDLIGNGLLIKWGNTKEGRGHPVLEDQL